MTGNLYPTDLTDPEWEYLQPLLPSLDPRRQLGGLNEVWRREVRAAAGKRAQPMAPILDSQTVGAAAHCQTGSLPVQVVPRNPPSLCCPDQTADHRAHVRLVDETSPTGAPLRSQTRTCRGLDLPRAYGASCSAGSFNLMSSIFQTRSENGQQIPAVIYEPHHAHRVGAEAASVPLMHRLANAPASHTPNPVSTGWCWPSP